MNQRCIIFQSLAVISLLEFVTSLEDVNLNDATRTVTSLLNILSKYENDVNRAIIQPNKWQEKNIPNDRNNLGKYNSRLYKGLIDDYNTHKRFQRPGNHILIKRLIPHGLPPSKLEFDRKYKTFYRPLVRVHKRKVLPKIETVLNVNGDTNGIDKYGIDVYDYYDNDETVLKFAMNKGDNINLEHFNVKEIAENTDLDEELLQPFTNKFTEKYDSPDGESMQLILLKEIQKLLNNLHSRPSRTKVYNDVAKVLDTISSLRSPGKSEEDNDLMAHGKYAYLENGEDEEGSQKPKKWIPHYSPWNFWTYKKTIYQDVCPHGQVKIANLCIWIPPH